MSVKLNNGLMTDTYWYRYCYLYFQFPHYYTTGSTGSTWLT